jgi:hypothetical protein
MITEKSTARRLWLDYPTDGTTVRDLLAIASGDEQTISGP